MGAQSISNIAGSAQSVAQIKFALPFATRALADALSASARVSRDPLSAGARNLRSDFDTRRSRLNIDNDRATTSLLQLGASESTLNGLVDTLEELEQLAASSAATTDTATRGNLNAAFRASIQSVIQQFAAVQEVTGSAVARATRSNANGFTVAGLNVLGGGAADVATSSIRVLGGTREIPSTGLEFTFEVVDSGNAANTAAFTTFNRTGSRGVIGNVVRNFNASNALNEDIEFEVAGALGTVTFSFAAGTDRDTILNALNDATPSTGVDAFVDATGNIDLYSSEYGAGHNVLVSQILDGASNHVAAGFDQGQNARAVFTDLQTGDSIDVEAEGRTFSFQLSGIDFEVDFYTDKSAVGASLLADSNALTGGGAVRAFHVAPGGLSLSSSGGSFIGIPELDVGALGGNSGRLLRAEIASNPQQALRIVQETRQNLGPSLQRIADAKNQLTDAISNNAQEITELDDNVATVQTLSGLIASFNAVRQDAERQSAYAVLSQISSFFPTSILPLLEARR